MSAVQHLRLVKARVEWTQDNLASYVELVGWLHLNGRTGGEVLVEFWHAGSLVVDSESQPTEWPIPKCIERALDVFVQGLIQRVWYIDRATIYEEMKRFACRGRTRGICWKTAVFVRYAFDSGGRWGIRRWVLYGKVGTGTEYLPPHPLPLSCPSHLLPVSIFFCPCSMNHSLHAQVPIIFHAAC